MLAPILSYLRQNKMPDIVFREITGNNIPHVLIVRNRDELLDQSISQFGNTAAYFGTGILMDKGINALAKRVLGPLPPTAKPWYFLGKSLSIFSMIAALNVAMPFLRNYITTSRTGTVDYAQMIGETQRTGNTASLLKTTLQDYKERYLKIVSAGAATSLAFLAGTAMAVKRGRPMPGALQFLQRHIGLEKGKFKNFNPLSAVLFWVVPTFSGLLAGARDTYEKNELALRFAAFNLAFFVFPHTVEKLIDKAVKGLPPTKLLGPSKNIAYLGKFISSLIFCSAVPTVLNIYLTRQRVRRDALKGRDMQPPKSALPQLPAQLPVAIAPPSFTYAVAMPTVRTPLSQ